MPANGQWRRYIHPNDQLLLVTRCSLAVALTLAYRVARGEPSLLRLGNEAAEAGQHLACQFWRTAVLAQPVLEGAHCREGQLIELGNTNKRRNSRC